MNATIKQLIDEIENNFWKQTCLFGHHKDTLTGLVKAGYTLVFDNGDADYPAAAKVSGYAPNYIC